MDFVIVKDGKGWGFNALYYRGVFKICLFLISNIAIYHSSILPLHTKDSDKKNKYNPSQMFVHSESQGRGNVCVRACVCVCEGERERERERERTSTVPSNFIIFGEKCNFQHLSHAHALAHRTLKEVWWGKSSKRKIPPCKKTYTLPWTS